MSTVKFNSIYSSLPDLLHLGKPFPDCQVFFRISDRMASYPLGQAGLTKFFFLQAGQSLSIYPAGLITIISVIAGASRDPACFPLAVHPPVIGTDFAGAVINRTPELNRARCAAGYPFGRSCPPGIPERQIHPCTAGPDKHNTYLFENSLRAPKP